MLGQARSTELSFALAVVETALHPKHQTVLQASLCVLLLGFVWQPTDVGMGEAECELPLSLMMRINLPSQGLRHGRQDIFFKPQRPQRAQRKMATNPRLRLARTRRHKKFTTNGHELTQSFLSHPPSHLRGYGEAGPSSLWNYAAVFAALRGVRSGWRQKVY
jgi:hypothetical protein